VFVGCADGEGYVDVHCHLADPQFDEDVDNVINDCIDRQLEYIVCNGIDKVTNRKTLELASRYPRHILPALGIHPINACCHMIDPTTWEHKSMPAPEVFDVDEELEFIEECAQQGKLAAIGEGGLDKYFITGPEAMAEQERVLRKLMKVGTVSLSMVP
jgi:Tat protein secretion system quality control protein TatD with DNase activity